MKKINLDISVRTSLIMKGIAILIISLHNIIHKLPNLPLENEFSYSKNGAVLFFSNSFFDSPFYFLFSFLGHYGVQIFIFLSAYAFYLKKKSILNFSKLQFYKDRYLRIFKPVVLSILVVSLLNILLRVIVYDGVATQTIINSFLGTYIGGFLHLLAIHPFLPENTPGGLGPWWFISFILQFYLLLPFLLTLKYNHINYLLFILGSIMLNFILTEFQLVNFNVFYTIFGHLPEIFFGFYYAQYLRHKKMHPIVIFAIFILSGVLTLLCNNNHILWYLATVPSTISLLSLLLFFNTIKSTKIINFVGFIGKISIYLFLINGITREFFIPTLIKSLKLNSIMLILSYLSFTIIISFVLYRMEGAITKILNR